MSNEGIAHRKKAAGKEKVKAATNLVDFKTGAA
jgi:hypothetical protein